MRDFAILWPSIALAMLTFAVWCTLFARRIPATLNDTAPLQAKATRKTRPAEAPLAEAANDNLLNLFELPVLFHLLCVMLAVTGLASPVMLTAAWAFVVLRAAHSLIHCTYNKVMHRFAAYLLSTLVLFGMWVAFALRLSAAA